MVPWSRWGMKVRYISGGMANLVGSWCVDHKRAMQGRGKGFVTLCELDPQPALTGHTRMLSENPDSAVSYQTSPPGPPVDSQLGVLFEAECVVPAALSQLRYLVTDVELRMSDCLDVFEDGFIICKEDCGVPWVSLIISCKAPMLMRRAYRMRVYSF